MNFSFWRAPAFIRAILMIGLISLAAACREENPEPGPSPTPSPSPSPTATPVPSPTPSPSPSASASLRTGRSFDLPDQVAQTNAEIILAASRDASLEIERLEQALRAVNTTSDNDISPARKALASAYHAFLHSEAALYYFDPVDPSSSLLDGLKASDISPETPLFESVGQLLTSYPNIPLDKLSLPNVRSEALQEIQTQTTILKAALQDFMVMWEADEPTNVRNNAFLVDATGAIGRILQGLLTVSEHLILEQANLLSSDPDRLAGRLGGFDSLYRGSYESLQAVAPGGFGVETLLQQSAPSLAESLGQNLDNLLQFSEKETSEERLRALQNLQDQILEAADSLGFVMELEPAPERSSPRP